VIHNIRDNTDIELRLVGFSLGEKIRTGAGYDILPETHPLHRALVGKLGSITDHDSFDSVSAFSAVRGAQNRGYYFNWVRGTLTVGSSGYSSFSEDPEGDHYYAEIHQAGQGPTVEELSDLIEELQLGNF